MSIAWYRPSSPQDALEVLRHGGTAVAGGAAVLSPALTSITMPDAADAVAVDVLSVLPREIDTTGIGAAATLQDLVTAPLARTLWPGLVAAAEATATPLVRAVATVGGTVGARLDSSDLAAALAAYACELDVVLLREGSGEAPETVTTSAVAYLEAPPPDAHLVTWVRPTLTGPGTYRRFALRPGPTPAVATVAGTRTATGSDLWAGAVGLSPAPVHLSPDAPPAALRTDHRASAAYRAKLVRVLAVEVLEELEGLGR